MANYPALKALKEPLYLNKGNIPLVLVRELQSVLKEGNFYSGNINGYLDEELFIAFKRFKERSYLEYPDVLGASTVTALLELVDEAKHPTPEDIKAEKVFSSKGKFFKLPGGEVVYCDQPIYGCKNFLWGEATKNGTRIPSDNQIVQNIIKLAQYLELVRALFQNRVIIIYSWHRPPDINRLVGGVSNSRHILGDAGDIGIQGISPPEVYSRLNNWHGARGGLGNSNAFTHIDLRGYCARWKYGNV